MPSSGHLDPVTSAARRIADVHTPGGDGLCSPCLRKDCEPLTTARHWLAVIRELPPAEPTAEDLAEARLIVKAHQGFGCPDCTPVGCDTEETAVRLLFDAVVRAYLGGTKTLAEVERIVREKRDDQPGR